MLICLDFFLCDFRIAFVTKPPCKLNIFCVLTTTESRAKIWRQLNAGKVPVTSAAVRSKAVVLLLLSHCLLLLPLFVGGCLDLVLVCST